MPLLLLLRDLLRLNRRPFLLPAIRNKRAFNLRTHGQQTRPATVLPTIIRRDALAFRVLYGLTAAQRVLVLAVFVFVVQVDVVVVVAFGNWEGGFGYGAVDLMFRAGWGGGFVDRYWDIVEVV